MVIILAVAGSDFAPIENDIMMHGKRTAMSLAISDLMSANLLRIFNERNRRRRAAAIRAMYAKEAVFGVHRPDSGSTAPAIPFVEDTKQIGRHQIGNCKAHSGAFPVHHNVVLNWSEIRSRDCQNYYHRFS